MTRRILAVLISIVLAVLGTVAVFLYVRTADARAVAGQKARVVVVAQKQIPAGTSGRALRGNDYLRTVTMPATTVPDDALEQVDSELDTLVVTSTVQPGQLLLRAMFGAPTQTTGGLRIPDGQIAIAARVKATVFGPGSVRAGARVAIFYTYTPLDEAHRNTVSGAGLERGHAINSVTRLLLTNIEILAVSGPGTAPADGDGARTGTSSGSGSGAGSGFDAEVVVTFAVSQVDAERLAHAVALGGELNIAMLSDQSDVRTDTGVDNRSLFG
jgi:pilus assembly protein CpaB